MLDSQKAGRGKKQIGEKGKKKRDYWIPKIFLMSIIISAVFSLVSSNVLNGAGYIIAFLLLAAVILMGIVFDIIGVSVTVAEQKGSASRVTLNEGLALSYLEELRIFARKNGLTDDLTLSDFCRLPDLFTTRMAEVDEDALWRDISETADGALDSFIAMRRREGEKLSADLAAKLYNILTLVEAVERRSPETVEAYRQRLYKKLGELLADRQIDDSRVLTEAALFADKVAVDEETVRLRSHIDQFRHILTLEEPVGRKLDFLVQEMNREANTIGSKAQDAEMARIVVELKSEIEKVREQIQNIE